MGDYLALPCECTCSSFVDKDQNHITKDKLRKTISNNKLLKVQSTEKKTADYKHGIFIMSPFSEWKRAVILAIDEKISYLSSKLTTKNSKNKLRLIGKLITEDLKLLHKFSVLVDKPSANVAIVC